MKAHELIRLVATRLREMKGAPVARTRQQAYSRAARLLVAAGKVEDPAFLARRAAVLVYEAERYKP